MLASFAKAVVRKHPHFFQPVWRLAYPWIYPFLKEGRYAGNEYAGSRAEAFTTIFRENRWGSEESVSGPGSSLDATRMLQHVLDGVFRRTNARSLLDAPCGDFNWMQHVNLPLGTAYIGADIVPDLVRQLCLHHGNKERRFIELDIVSDPLPEANLWLCRHVLMHLSNADVKLVLENFARSRIDFLLVDNHSFVRSNADIVSGGWRFVNLMRPPFNLPKPLATYPNSIPPAAPDYLHLWERSKVRSAMGL